MTFLITYSLNGFTHKMRVKNAESEADAQRKFTLWIHKKYSCMEIKEFIINWIEVASKNFEDISMKYAIEKVTNFHIIEISPDSIESSEEFSKEALDFEFDFFDKFPNEDLLICEESIENDMSNVIFEYK